ncbi:ATP-binding protein [Pararhizobium sp. DWP3-4]|uniref:ATP-binding protein n=1 Tax=Pararhizobium sp. DWP3-4 TaxID=2804565 RepID=UPI003CF2215D
MNTLTLLEQFDWSKTALGAFEQWPAERRSLVKTALGSTFPIWLALGKDLTQIYNDGYNRIYGDKHPKAFGAPAIESWPEIWEFLKPALDRVKLERQPYQFSDHLLPLKKKDRIEECYFSFCYSPVFSADGGVEGVMAIALETTQDSIEKRRQPLINLIVEVSSSEPHPISKKLCELLEHNELDAKSALVLKENSPEDSVEWALRCQGGLAGEIASIYALTSTRKPYDIVAMEKAHRNSDHADFLGFVRFTAADGKSQKVLVLRPSALVTEKSLLDLLTKLEKRLQVVTQQLVSIGSIKDELAQSDLVYRFLFENTLDGVMFTSPDLRGQGAQRIIAANKAACDMLGYDPDEIVGMHRDDFFFPEDDELELAVAERAQQQVFTGELIFRHKSGRPIKLEITSIISNLQSGQTRAMSILRDWEQEFNVERERAERSRLESIAQMTGGISHDFNNLLTVILSAAEHLDGSITDPDQKDVVGDILTASSRAAKLTSQLLAYSRRQNLQPAAVDINFSIQQIERLVRTVGGKEVQFQFDYSRRNLVAEIDVAQLTSALINLIKNASDAIDGQGLVAISTRLDQSKTMLSGLSLRPGKYVTIAVRDNGVGIPPKVLPRIFDPFFTTKSNLGGSGLGLSMVQGFARQSGGDIVVESAPGAGTTATLYIPAGTSRPKAKVIEPANHVVEAVSGKDVLIVDDDPLIRRQVALILKSIGLTCREAGTGAEAIDLLNARPQLVLTDLAMPGERTGADVVEACRQAVPHIPVIVMSGLASDQRWASALLRAGETLAKPFSREDLVAAIERNLLKTKRWQG